jgi:hypothetical protein
MFQWILGSPPVHIRDRHSDQSHEGGGGYIKVVQQGT